MAYIGMKAKQSINQDTFFYEGPNQAYLQRM